MSPICASLQQAHFPLSYWPDALRHVVFCNNVKYHRTNGRSPFEHLLNENPKYIKHLRTFGCQNLVEQGPNDRTKMQRRFVEGINLGHIQGGMYKTININGTVTSKHVRFIEGELPGMPKICVDTSNNPPSEPVTINVS